METAQNVIIGKERNKGKTTAQRVIHQRNGTIRRIHGGQYQHIGGDAKRLATARQMDGLVAILEQIHEFAKDAAQIGPIDFVDDQHARPVALTRAVAKI